MKKGISLLLATIMTFMAVPVMAVEFEEEQYFDFYGYEVSKEIDDEIELMEVEDSVYEEFERRLIEAWTNIEGYNPDERDLPSELSVYIGDLRIEKEDIYIYSKTVRENPRFFYVQTGFGGATVKGKTYMGYITPKYTETDKSVIEKTWAEIDKAVEEILLYISPEMTDFEKIMTVHDYMDVHYVYDKADTDQTYRILLDKRGVCAAYAEAFQHLMNVLGIESTVVTSDEMKHMWNLVKVGKWWYHIDVTGDDPVPDQFAYVCHEHVLLSQKAIEAMEYFGFTTANNALSIEYDKAPWRYEKCAIAVIDGVMYRKDGNNIVDENDNIIYKKLDGGDGIWNLRKGAGIEGDVFAGICEINGVLYFNTDTGIMSYEPKTKEIKTVVSDYGICGIFAERNTIQYNTYDFEQELFIKKGEVKVSDICLGEPYYEDGKAVVRLYNGYDMPVFVISEGDEYRMQKIEADSIGTARFENGAEQRIFIWTESLEPAFEDFIMTE